MFLVEFGLLMDTRIIEILWHKLILLQVLKNMVTRLKCDDIFSYKLPPPDIIAQSLIFWNIEYNIEI